MQKYPYPDTRVSFDDFFSKKITKHRIVNATLLHYWCLCIIFALPINADTAGFFTSMLCAIHCSAVPVLISLGLLGSGTWLHNHMIDWVVIGFGIIIASYSLLGDFVRKHRNLLPLGMALTGFLFLLIGTFPVSVQAVQYNHAPIWWIT